MRLFKLAALALAVCLMAAVSWLVLGVSRPSVEARPFDREEWLRNADLASGIGDPGCVRGAEALYLVERKALIGMSKGAVSAMLGAPSQHGSAWAYALGQCSGYGWNHSELVVRFGEKGEVVAARFTHAP
jgi:hypothetical protein